MCSTMTSVRVHDDAEIERAQAQQVRRNAGEVHADEGEQQRQRNRDGGQQRGAHAAEKQEQHRDHDHQPFEQRVRDRAQRVVDQVGAVVDRDDLHARAAGGWRSTRRPLP